VDLTKRITIRKAKKVARKLFPIGSIVTLDKSDALCTGLVIGHIFYNIKDKELLSVLCKLLVLRGKDKYVAMISADKDNNVEIWSSDIDLYFEKDWASDDWVLET
jgi:hypothetical protein